MRIAQLAVVCLVVMLAPVCAPAQEQAAQDQQQMAGQQQMAPMCQMMMQKHQKMVTKLEQMNQELEQLVNKVNTATGQEKIDAMAELLTKAVEQRKEMLDMIQEGPKMMRHMCQHMGQVSDQAKKAMSCCPMMQDKATTPTGGMSR